MGQNQSTGAMGERLHAMCASHIGGKDGLARLGMLRDMVGSWRSQTVACPLTVSISSDSRVAPLVARVVEELRRSSPESLEIVVHEGERLSQFQHYRLMLRGFAELGGEGGATTWVLFTDDDDVWHPRRVEHYKAGLRWLSEHGVMDKVLALRARAILIGPFQGSDVERALRSGHVTRQDRGHEHWMFCCKASTLQDFVERAGEELLADKYCDMYLIKYLAYSEGNKCADVEVTHAQDWGGALYAYRHGAASRHRASICDGSAEAEAEAVRQMVVLAYSELVRGTTSDQLTRKLTAFVKEAYGVVAKSTFLQACRRLVRSGAVDAFVDSPMPGARCCR